MKKIKLTQTELPFTIASKRRKIFRNKTNQGGKRIITETSKTLMKEIKADISKWERHPMVMD